jgi:hypothetical protein
LYLAAEDTIPNYARLQAQASAFSVGKPLAGQSDLWLLLLAAL